MRRRGRGIRVGLSFGEELHGRFLLLCMSGDFHGDRIDVMPGLNEDDPGLSSQIEAGSPVPQDAVFEETLLLENRVCIGVGLPPDLPEGAIVDMLEGVANYLLSPPSSPQRPVGAGWLHGKSSADDPADRRFGPTQPSRFPQAISSGTRDRADR